MSSNGNLTVIQQQSKIVNPKSKIAPPAIPKLIHPNLKFNDDQYAALQMRLDLYDDYILAVKYKKGVPGASFAVDPDDLAAAVAHLSVSTGLLPPRALFWTKRGSEERIGIYLPPRVWPLSIAGDKLTWHIPLPGMIFIGQHKSYVIYAIKDTYPAAETKLYRAPVGNLSNSVCAGNVQFPIAGPDTIQQAVDAFFQSGFNNHLIQLKSKKYPANILKMWRELKGKKIYPLDDLTSANKTLQQVIK